MKKPRRHLGFHLLLSGLLLPAGTLLPWLASPPGAWACTVSKTPPQNFFFLPSRQRSGLFFEDPESGAPGPTIIEGCKESVGQYLMVSLPVRQLKPGGRTADLFFNPPFRPDPCRLDGSPFPRVQGAEVRRREIERQYRLLRKCTYFDVVELTGSGLAYPESQPAATAERISRSHARFRGDLFFLQIQRNSRFAIGLGLDAACTRPSILEQERILPGEASALLNTYIAGDASGLTTDLTAIGSSRVRVLVSPPEGWVPASSADGSPDSPVWPDQYRLSAAFGSLEIRPQKNKRHRLDFSPVIQRPEERDAPFFLPFAGELLLSERSPRSWKVIDSWFFGDVVPPGFEGFLQGFPRLLRTDSLRAGSRYRLELVMGDPNQDYRLFKNGIQQLWIDLKSVFGLPGEDILESFSGVLSLSGLKGSASLPELSGNEADQAIEQAVRGLALTGPPPAWPPFYRSTCVGPDPSCLPIRQMRRIRQFGIEFGLGPVMENGTHRLEDPVFYEESGGTRRELPSSVFPALDCLAPPSE
jgi:hypothetical protein